MDVQSVANVQNIDQSAPAVKTNAHPAKIKSTDVHAQKSGDKDNNQESQDRQNKSISEVVDDLNSQIESLNTNIEFGYNDKLGQMYITVREKGTGALIRQFPSDEAMALAERFKEINGIIFDKKG